MDKIKVRIDKVLAVCHALPSRTKASQFVRDNIVFVNGLEAKPSTYIYDGDEVEINLANKSTKFIVYLTKKEKVVYISLEEVETHGRTMASC